MRHHKQDTNQGSLLPEWYDIHSHILPGVDDGCQTVPESLELLKYAYQSGVTGIMATPHYYPKETIREFLVRRNAAYDMLMRDSSDVRAIIPKIKLGAEVSYYEGILDAPDLKDLCMGSSRYLLLELPFKPWNQNVIKNINALKNVCGIIPIIAHLERYIDMQTTDTLEDLYRTEALIQINAESILKKDTARYARKIVKNGYVQVLGSDTHNMHGRKPNLMEAVHALDTSKTKNPLEQIRMTNWKIFAES